MFHTDREAAERMKKIYEINDFYDYTAVQIVDKNLLKQLKTDYKNTDHATITTNFYNIRNEFSHTWIDSEGNKMRFFWNDEVETVQRKSLQKKINRYIHEKQKKIKKNEEFAVVSISASEICYHFLERETELRDKIFIFSNKPNKPKQKYSKRGANFEKEII